MMTTSWGRYQSEDTNIQGDPYLASETALRSSRHQLTEGDQTYLPSRLPANSAWWYDDALGWTGFRLYRAASAPVEWDITTPDFEQNFVMTFSGPASEIYMTRPNQWALVDEDQFYVTGDVPIWAQPVAEEPEPYYEFDGMSGGW